MFRSIFLGIVGVICYLLAQFSLVATLDNHSSLQVVLQEFRQSTSSSMVVGNTQKLKSITLSATGQHTATVIFIHGLGDTGQGWKPVADMFKGDLALSHVKWVLPHSPTRPVKANLGIVMPSWYVVFSLTLSDRPKPETKQRYPSRERTAVDIIIYRFDIDSFGFVGPEDEKGMHESVALIQDLIQGEIESGVDPSRIVLGGFSQGAAMSLLTGLTSNYKLGGIACLSGWLPLQHKFISMVKDHALSTPIFWGHGSSDPLVKLQYSKDSSERLFPLGMSRGQPGVFGGLSFNIYDGMGHTTIDKELEDLKAFIKNAVPAP